MANSRERGKNLENGRSRQCFIPDFELMPAIGKSSPPAEWQISFPRALPLAARRVAQFTRRVPRFKPGRWSSGVHSVQFKTGVKNSIFGNAH